MTTQTQLIEPQKLPEFQQFWEAYPRKESKADAEKAFRQVFRETDLPTLLKSIESHKQTEQWKKDNGKFIPLAASFLRAKRWQDSLTLTATVEQLTPVDKQIRHGEYLRILEAMRNLRQSYDEHQTWSPKDKQEYRTLMNRRNELRTLLGLLR